MKKLVRILLIYILAFSVLYPLTCEAYSARGAIAVEATGFDIYYSSAEYEHMPIASVTKIMTAVVAIELCDDLDRIVSIPECAVGIEGTSVYLHAGEHMSIRQLLYAVLLNSANDAALACAVCICGDENDFVDQMNRKAALLCMDDTVYTNPHGLPEDGQYSCAHDQAILACYAMNMSDFTKICSTFTYQIPYEDTDNGRTLVNHNRLLRSYSGCMGIKTGYTKVAGRCLVSSAERDGVRLICVTLSDPDDWRDHAALLNTGFEIFENIPLTAEREQGIGIPLCGKNATLLLCNDEGLRATVRRIRQDISKVTECDRFVYEDGQKRAGWVKYYLSGRLIGKVQIKIQEN